MPDLTALFQIVSFLACLLLLYVMQQTGHDPASQHDSHLLRLVRRAFYTALILGMAWNIDYHDKAALPASGPEWLMILGLTGLFGVRAVILYLHRHDRVDLVAGQRIISR